MYYLSIGEWIGEEKKLNPLKTSRLLYGRN